MKNLLLIIVTIFMFVACNKQSNYNYPELLSTSTEKYIVASQKIYAQTSDACTGTTFTMQAFAVKGDSDKKWAPFFYSIKNFEYNEGVEYIIEVKKERFYDPRNSVQYWDEYTLTKIISEQEKDSENMPISMNSPCIDTYIDGEQLTDK